MSTPKQRHSQGRTSRKRAQYNVKPVQLQECTNCGEKITPHQACQACGYYKGRQVLKNKEVVRDV